MRALRHLERIEFVNVKTGEHEDGNALSFHWNRFGGTTFRVVNQNDRIVNVHENEMVCLEGGEW